MIYNFLKFVLSTSLRIFFRRISTHNQDRSPKNGPVIFVCNHPNLVIDAWLVGMTCKRRLFFLAKSTIFKGEFVTWLLIKLGIIPVYRQQDNPNEISKNEDTFARAYKILEDEGAFLIFPEGISVAERRLNKIKTGAARIGFGALASTKWSSDVIIMPVGLSYSNIIKFKSDVIIKYGNPICLRDFKERYLKDEFETVKEVTNQIETALRNLTTNVNIVETEEVVSALELIYKKELMVELGLDEKNQSDDFAATKGLVDGVEWYFQNKPNEVEEFKTMLSNYQRNLDLLQIKDEFLNPNTKSITLTDRLYMYLYMIIGFPIYIFGIVTNFIPYKAPRWVAMKYNSAKSEIASIKLVVGMALFIAYYGLGIYFFHGAVSDSAFTIVYALSLIPAGNFVLSYVRKIRRYREHLRFLTMFYQKTTIVSQIQQERKELIDFINRAKDEYVKINKSQ